MKILSLDTTGLVASCAVSDENSIIAEYTTNYKKTHSRTILPMIEEIMKMVEIKPEELDYIACSCGPGSFTGLRIGAATAKGMANALDIKIIPIPTLDALAQNMIFSSKIVVPVMDARRNQVYTSIYDMNDGVERLADYMACDIDSLLETVYEISDNAVFLGDGVSVYGNKIIEKGFDISPQCHRLQRASSIASLALERIDNAVCGEDFEIMYLRKSQAEREREEKNATGKI